MNQVLALAGLLLATSIAQASYPGMPRCPEKLEPEERAIPIYPTDTYEEGWVVVEFIVLASGNTDDPRVVESSSRKFERSAVRAILQYRYAEQNRPCWHLERLNYMLAE